MVNASPAGAWVAGASVAGAPQAVIMDRTVTITVTSKTNFLLFADMFIFSYDFNWIYFLLELISFWVN
jgi:hypothetical protein